MKFLEKCLHIGVYLGFTVYAFLAPDSTLAQRYLEDAELSLPELLDSAALISKVSSSDAISLYEQIKLKADEVGDLQTLALVYKKVGNLQFNDKDYGIARLSYLDCIGLDSTTVDAADAYFNMALISRKQDNQDELFEYLDKSLYIYNKVEDSDDKFSTYHKVGILYKNAAKYHTALKYLLPAYRWFDKADNLPKLASVCALVGNVQRNLGHYDKAKLYYSKSLNARIASKDSIKIADSFNSLGNLYKSQLFLDSAGYYYVKAIELKKKIKDSRELGRMMSNLAAIHHQKGELKNAEKMYNEALLLKYGGKDTLSLANTFNEMAHLAVERKTYILAKRYLDSTAFYSKSIDDKDFSLRNLQTKAYYYESSGNKQEAIDNLRQYSTLYQTIFNDKQVLAIQELQEKFDTKNKENRILELTLSNEERKSLLAIKDVRLKNRNRLLLFLVSSLVAISFIFLLLRKLQKNRHRLDKVQAVYNGQEVLKEKMSSDLHDIVVSNYEGIRLKLQTLFERERLPEEDKKILGQISEINQQVRMISYRLSPLGNKIQTATLTEIIESQLVEFQMHQGIEVSVDLPLPEVLDLLNLNAQTNFYGIFLEILNNVGKHSFAKMLSIQHYAYNNYIQFSFSDNGIGFDSNKKPGLGIKNMGQRMDLLNGTIQLNSSDNGTTIHIQFPIKENLK